MSPAARRVNLAVHAEYPVYAVDNVNSVYVNCAIQAPSCPDVERKPVDIVVVLDRSGSMSGSKLNLCKETIAFLIGELSCKDRLSLVTYDTVVRTDMALTRMDAKGKQQTEDILKKINTGDCTNLSGGLFAGVQEVQNKRRNDKQETNPVRSVLILTDGLANHGLTKTADIVKMLKDSLEPNVSVFTFGYGSDHNADMLRNISEAGRGVYYFVQNVDGVALAFADCLGGLLSVVAQNIKLECVALNGCTIQAIKTRKPTRPVSEGRHYEIDIGDLYGDEQRDVLVELTLPGLAGEKQDFMTIAFRLSYANVLSSNFDKLEATCSVQRVSTPAKDQTPDSHITQQKNRILTAEAMEKATSEAEKGRLEEGREALEDALNELTLQMESLGESDKLASTALLRDLKECQDNMSTRDQYQMRGQYRMQAQMQSHFAQRSSEVEVDRYQVQAECLAAPMSKGGGLSYATVQSGYRNSKKSSMLHKIFGAKR